MPKSRDCFFIVVLAGVGPKEPNGLTLYQALKHSLRVGRGEVEVGVRVNEG